ncbi:MAG TPA: AAA family ATPase [Xanthobacteraceae bacterium]|jgi:hypothetical protein|nr:AAA family ATPase [Xanthobacteraceae bacterium]
MLSVDEEIVSLIEGAESALPHTPEITDIQTRFRLRRFGNIRLSTAPDYLVKGIIPARALVVTYGPPKCGKSFWTFDLVMHVALGRPYRGHKVRQGPVVYLALEGGGGFCARIEAWRQRFLPEEHDDVAFNLIDVSVDLIADHPRLILDINAQTITPPAVVVVDTLNRALLGDENKSSDMASFIRAADAIREAFSCTVIIVHHTGLAGGRPRGHSALPGADDALISVERNDAGVITVTVEHMKDAEAGAVISSRLDRCELGIDDEGDPITSCVIVPTEGNGVGPKRPRLSPIAIAGLRALNECLASTGRSPPDSQHFPAGVACVTLTEWREYLIKLGLINREGGFREQFRRLRVTLKNAGAIGIWDDNVWVVT